MDLKAIAALLAVSVPSGFLYFVIAVLSLRFPARQLQHKWIAAISILLCLQSLMAVLEAMHRLVVDDKIQWYLDLLGAISQLSLGLAAGFGLALSLLWAGLAGKRAFLAGMLAAAASITAWLANIPGVLVATALLCALLVAYAAARESDASVRRYRWLMALFVAAIAILQIYFSQQLPQIATRILPAFCTLVFIVRQSQYGLHISRRFLLLNVLAGGLAVYMLAIRVLANFGRENFDWFEGMFEILMVLPAAILWVPLYSWMFSSLVKRRERATEFNQRLMQEAVRILELDQRAHLLVRQIAAHYRLHRAALYQIADQRTWSAGEPINMPDAAQLELLRLALIHAKPEALHVLRSPDEAVRKVLADRGLTYVFPLWYDETHLTGMLLADTRPRRYLDDTEPALANVCTQAAHSLEACRLVEEKIVLEKALVRQEHLATLGKVAATIAHEVKNPLSAIKTLAQLMREDEGVNRQYEQDLRFIIGETDRLNTCVQQLLTFSRPVPASGVELSLNGLLGDIARALSRDYEARSIHLDLRVEPDLRMLGADTQSIQQIVMNLTLNALQASVPGDTVVLDAARDNGNIRISVTDQGPGIPPDLQEKIFEPFFTTKQKGTGLGLAIVRKNVQHLEGDLRVASPVEGGRGTRFTVTLPVPVSAT